MVPDSATLFSLPGGRGDFLTLAIFSLWQHHIQMSLFHSCAGAMLIPIFSNFSVYAVEARVGFNSLPV